jgi:hypothetical protein
MASTPISVDDHRDAHSTAGGDGGARLARIVSLAPDGALRVDIGDGCIVPARLAMSASPEQLLRAVAERQQAVVVSEGGDRGLPIIVGLLQTTSPAQLAVTDLLPAVEIDADGRRLRVTAQDEIVLQCGSASITLRRNGRVVIRGTYVETHSEGTNRVRGAQVQIN